MADEKSKKSDGEFDIFVANLTYPEAAQILSASLKSLDAIQRELYRCLRHKRVACSFTTDRQGELLEQIRKTYKSLVAQKRLVVPGQVAREFAKNRAGKMHWSSYFNN